MMGLMGAEKQYLKYAEIVSDRLCQWRSADFLTSDL